MIDTSSTHPSDKNGDAWPTPTYLFGSLLENGKLEEEEFLLINIMIEIADYLGNDSPYFRQAVVPPLFTTSIWGLVNREVLWLVIFDLNLIEITDALASTPLYFNILKDPSDSSAPFSSQVLRFTNEWCRSTAFDILLQSFKFQRQ